MNDGKFFVGAGVLVAFLLFLAVLIPRDRGPDVESTVAAELEPITETVEALSGRVEGIESSVAEMQETLAGAVSPDEIENIGGRIDEIASQTGALGESIETLKQGLSAVPTVDDIASIETQVQSLTDQVDAAGASTASANAPADADSVQEETAVTESTTVASDATEPVAESVTDSESIKAGETALFAEGDLRVFVSRLDDAEGTASVMVVQNDERTMRELQSGQAITVQAGDDYCRLTVNSIAGAAMGIDAVCGDNLPEPEGLSAGETAVFKDGLLRVFASNVYDDGARLFLNGDSKTLMVGRSVPISVEEEGCRVYLDAVDRGHASVSSLCGEDVPVSDLVGPGSTVVLGDDAARVFVAAVTDDNVRFSINGQNLIEGGQGKSVAIGESCKLVVEDIDAGKANFSYACDQ